MKKNNKGDSVRLKNKVKRILIFLGSFLIIYFILFTTISPEKYDLKEGDIATKDIKAPRETVDEKATETKLNEALAKVDTQYTKKSDVKQGVLDNITQMFLQLNDLEQKKANENEKITEISKIINIDNQYIKQLVEIDNDSLYEYKDKMLEIINKLYEQNNISYGDEESLNQAKDFVKAKLEELEITDGTLQLWEIILTNEVKPDFFYDSEKTNEKLDEIRGTTENVIIKKNQIIVKEGEPVTASQIEVLQSIGLLRDNENSDMFFIYINLILFVGIISLIQYIYLYRFEKSVYADSKKIIMINVINILQLILALGFGMISPYLIPIACAPLLTSLLIDNKVSMFINLMNILYIGIIVGFDPNIIILALINILMSSVMLKKTQQRNDILYAVLYIGLTSALITFSIGVILSSNTSEVLINCLYAIIGVVVSGILAIGILPFMETCFGVVTVLKLLELSNPNSPLLKKLLMEAPGTYHHSMMVANLAEMAADEVKANSVITRVGAYYHDIGKIERPYFFKENQLNLQNPHDKITPNLSALIIISHIKDGVELAKEYKLPKVVIDIIQQHHGKTLVKYFYYTMKNDSDNPDEIKEEDFRYPGPIPNTKEAGIIMLADSTEAAVRSLKHQTEENIVEMINSIIDDKLTTGELNNCDLTLKDINKIRKCFVKALNGIYHKRIEYPKELKK